MLQLFFLSIFFYFHCFATAVNSDWMHPCICKDFACYRDKQYTKEDFHQILACNKHIFLCTIKHRHIKFFGSFDSPLGEEEVKKRLRSILSALKNLNATKNLSNICFLLSVEDSFNKDLPVLTFAKEQGALSICIPDFEALRGYQALDQQIDEGIQACPLEEKIDKAFWRGSTTGGVFSLANWKNFPRSKLVMLSLEHPMILDARFSMLLQAEPKEFFELKQLMTKEKMFAKGTCIKEHLQYKFLIDVDGNSCTYSRLYWILTSNSLCIKQLSNHMQWYYPLLIPYEHFLPFSSSFSDLLTQIDWAKGHPREVEKMIENANLFAKTHLRHEDALLYLYHVLENYRKIIDYRSFLKRS